MKTIKIMFLALMMCFATISSLHATTDTNTTYRVDTSYQVEYTLVRVGKCDTMINPIKVGNHMSSYFGYAIYDSTGVKIDSATVAIKIKVNVFKVKDKFVIRTGKLSDTDVERQYRIDTQTVYNFSEGYINAVFNGVGQDNEPIEIVWFENKDLNQLMILFVSQDYTLTFYIGDFGKKEK